MESETRIRINLSSRELEISGSEDFVNDKFYEYIDYIRGSVQNEESKGHSTKKDPEDNGLIPQSFDKYLHQFSFQSLSGVDQFLVASNFLQNISETKTVSTREVTELLKKHGVSLSNSSEARRRNLNKSYIFNDKKGTFKVSLDGEKYLEEIKEVNKK